MTQVEYPSYIAENDRFGVIRGPVLVLTHECDIDPENERLFNDAALICPIIPLENFAEAIDGVLDDKAADVFIRNVTARYVNRLVYIPIVPGLLPFGGYLYLNLLSTTHLSRLTRAPAAAICMLSSDGLREIDLALERHLRRPKSDRLAFQTDFFFGRDA